MKTPHTSSMTVLMASPKAVVTTISSLAVAMTVSVTTQANTSNTLTAVQASVQGGYECLPYAGAHKTSTTAMNGAVVKCPKELTKVQEASSITTTNDIDELDLSEFAEIDKLVAEGKQLDEDIAQLDKNIEKNKESIRKSDLFIENMNKK